MRTIGENIRISWLGLRDYQEVLQEQLNTAESVRRGQPATLLACEHPAVVTLGKRSQTLDDILVSLDILRQNQVNIINTDRGGHATLHNPGQLVLYPILPLRRWDLGVRDYVECLERASAFFFADHGIEVTRGYEPGLWVEGKKIASFGIRVDRGVSMHGVALNISNDLTPFGWIKQCGQAVNPTNLETQMTAFMETVPPWNMAHEARRWLDLFQAELAAINKRTPFELDVPNSSLLQEDSKLV